MVLQQRNFRTFSVVLSALFSGRIRACIFGFRPGSGLTLSAHLRLRSRDGWKLGFYSLMFFFFDFESEYQFSLNFGFSFRRN